MTSALRREGVGPDEDKSTDMLRESYSDKGDNRVQKSQILRTSQVTSSMASLSPALSA